MAEPLRKYFDLTDQEAVAAPRRQSPAYETYRLLQFLFVVAPIIAGLDKFFHLLVNWDQYLAPIVTRVIPVAPHTFMLGVGVVEIVAGIGVALAPQVFGYVVAAWLAGIIVNLLLIPGYFDIALRDFGLAVSAFALARLARRLR
jgi:hypothetical protein